MTDAEARARARVFGRLDRSEPGACHLWPGGRDDRGYATSRIGGTTRRLHRLVWIWQVGPIPEDHVIHHRCGALACLNPDHMLPMTAAAHTALHHRARRRLRRAA